MYLVWIDDDVLNLEAQQEFLTDRGFIVEVIDNVDEAWRRLEAPEGRPDGIIIDIMMATGQLLKNYPTKGGLVTGSQFLRRMEQAGLLQNIKVMIYTITADPDVKAAADEPKVYFYRKQSAPGKRLVDIALAEFGEP